MDTINWTEVIVAALVLAGTIYGHWKTAKASRDKTIDAVKSEMSAAIQTVKEEVAGIRAESQAKDEEMHAELLMFKQETASGLALIQKDVSTLSERVERHNNVIDRTYKLEQAVAVHGERLENLERGAK